MEREDFMSAAELLEIEKDGVLTSFEAQKELEFQQELKNKKTILHPRRMGHIVVFTRQ